MTDTYMKFRNEVMAGGASDRPGEPETAGGITGVLSLVGIIALLALLGWWSTWALVFVVGLLVSIFLHEAGHFLTAKATGMKVTQFFLFMGPKLFSFRRGETEYGLRLLPVGAFVRIIGMNNLDDVEPGDEDRAYRSKSYPRRMLVICAGSITHIIIAIALLFGVYAVNGKLEPTGRVGLGSISEGYPAAAAGLEPGDIVESVNGDVPTSASELTQLIRSIPPGDTATLVVSRDGVQLTKQVQLGTNPDDPTNGKGYLGVSSGAEIAWDQASVGTALRRSLSDLGDVMWRSVSGVITVLNPVNIWQHVVGTNNDPSTQPSTVYGISKLSATIGDETGMGGILLTLAGVNVFVGLLNLFPLLPFDGGHAAIATYERLRSRRGQAPYRADVSKMIPVTMLVMMLLGFLVFAGLYLDVAKPPG